MGSISPLAQLVKEIEGIGRTSFAEDGERMQALRAAYALVSRLETSWDTVARLVLIEPALGAALKVCRDLQLFEKWAAAATGGSKTSVELADMTGCEDKLLARILRHLSATHLVDETAPGLYAQTAFTQSLLEPVFGGWIDYLYDATLPCFEKMPIYLAQHGYKNPEDATNGVFQYTKGFRGSLFDYYDTHPVEGEVFNHMMGGVMAKQAGMLDLYPLDRLIDSKSSSTTSSPMPPLLVDVGGNVGHDINKFLAKQPELASRLVLQDRPDVVKLAKCPPTVRVMAHDFFTPQPVKGARAYYMHGVIHDWSDEPARQILERTRDAMTKGYSRLLVHDHVLPASKPHPQATAYDLAMMVKVSAFERTEKMWEDLLGSAGFRIVRIWDSPLATQSVIEAELA